MFYHNFKYTIKTLLKDRVLIFWTLAFPLILGTLFNMAFSDIENKEKLEIIDIAIIDNTYFTKNEIYKETFLHLGNKNNKDRLFNIKYVDEEQAKKLLAKKRVTGYLKLEENSKKVVIAQNGINETIFKYVTEEINEQEKIIKSILEYKLKDINSSINLDKFYNDLYKNIKETMNNNRIQIKDISSNNLSYTMIEFYTLIAMTCLYGGILGMVAISKNLANISNIGKRVSISPVSKKKLILSSILASYIIQVIGIILLFIYTNIILKIDYGNDYLLVILLSLVGTFAGLCLGTFIACIFKLGENTKTGIIIALTMFFCFLSGMMGITMKYIIDKNIPLLNKINPANMITDGFYSLYYYDTKTRFYFNVISLLLFSIILLSISILSLRRQKYDNI